MDFFEYLDCEKNLILNDEQKSAVDFDKGNALVLSTAGSGKTTVITCRAAKLIYDGKCDSKILTITFSKFAAKDMKKRFEKIFPEKEYIGRIEFSTIHSFMYKIVNEYFRKSKINRSLLQNNFKVIENILKKVYSNNYYNVVNEDEIENVISEISYVKNMMYNINSEYIRDNAIKNLKEIMIAYDKYKSENKCYDFDDMLVYGYNILKKYGNYVDKIKKKFSYIQIDEMQDTSKLQIAIIREISNNNLFMVGDDDQAIYSFRGSYPDFMLNFSEIYPDGSLFYLSKNYRSDAYIVNAAKRLISKNKNRYPKNIIPEKILDEKVNVLKVKNRALQNDYILKSIKKFKNKKIGILYRYNISSVIVANGLNENNIKFTIKDDKNKFFNNFVLRDIVSFIQLAEDNTNVDAFSNIYYKSYTYFSRDMCNFVRKSDTKKSVFDTLRMYPNMKDYMYERITSFENDINMIKKIKMNKLIDHIKYNIEYFDYLERLDGEGRNRLTSTELILDIINDVAKYSVDTDEFIKKISGLKKVLREAKTQEADIMLNSIHGSKGLEYDIVYLVDNTFDEFPRRRKSESLLEYEQYLEEERRMFYVALTRARERAFIFTGGNPSQFVEELISKK